MYVHVDSTESAHFTEKLASILGGLGFKSSIGRSVEGHGQTLYVLEANSIRLRIWAQNMPLDPREARRCGYENDVAIDPHQYIVSVQPWLPLFARSARKTHADLRMSLVKKGYVITDKPVACKPIKY
jgi:hypothetical protein